MWPPPNMHSLPSREEIQKTKQEICCIELEITEAQLKLDALARSLADRKAWIAPIRRTPHEILSPIFVEVSRNDWTAPLALQSVCRRWREVVIDTPEAWTFIPLSTYSSYDESELVSMFLQRSRNASLHILLDDDTFGYMKTLEERIECIRLNRPWITANLYLQNDSHFPRLERLNITITGWNPPPPVDLAPWDMSSFPNLQVLYISAMSPFIIRAISGAHEFPAIRHLTVHCGEPWDLLNILAKCAKSLESVDLRYNTFQIERPHGEFTVHFPCLRYLRLEDMAGIESRFYLNLTTPNLEAYVETGSISISKAVQVSTNNVTLLDVVHAPNLSHYPRIVGLWFSGGENDVLEGIECLRDNPTLCPELTMIGYGVFLSPDRFEKIKNAILMRESLTGRMIQLVEETSLEQDERIWVLKGLEPCADHMPCNYF